ncbi:MAG: hypothetical protein MH252_17640, partial [Thermosynechococcaceae cyanobacterium MS004]|nr:hypothetical protein [Thermosynechococcaceae cyanobacterium MS004]
GRVVEGAALEMLFRGNFNEGSNPSLSVLELDSLDPDNLGLDNLGLSCLNIQFSCLGLISAVFLMAVPLGAAFLISGLG